MELSTEDLNNFDLAIGFSKAIFTFYHELYELESAGKKNTKLYKNKLEFLRWLETEELKLYNCFNLNAKKMNTLIELLALNTKKNTIDRIMTGNYENCYKVRAYNNLCKHAYSKKDFTSQYLSDEDDCFQKYGHDVKTELELTNAFNDDFNNLFLKKLQLAIKKKSNSSYKDYLIEAKYMLAFMENKLEYVNYNALQDFSNFELLSRIYSIDSEESIEIANSLKYDKLISRVKMMLQISDDEYNYDSVKIANIFLDCYVKTYLEMTDLDEAIGITIDINEIILSLGATNNYKSVKTLAKMIERAIKY